MEAVQEVEHHRQCRSVKMVAAEVSAHRLNVLGAIRLLQYLVIRDRYAVIPIIYQSASPGLRGRNPSFLVPFSMANTPPGVSDLVFVIRVR